MQNNKIVPHEEWTTARVELLRKEKEFFKLRDQISRQARALPWEKVDKSYLFQGSEGIVGLDDLFGVNSQLIVYHFMFDTSWDEGCPSCSLVTDSIDPAAVHLASRDVAVVLVSQASAEKLTTFRERMGWTIPWLSSLRSDFNLDFQATTGKVTPEGEYYYNYSMTSAYPPGEHPGLSVFVKDSGGQIYHTYSTYARGLETFIGTYSLLDIVPKGRDEEGLAFGMEWVRLKDRYDTEPAGDEGGCCER